MNYHVLDSLIKADGANVAFHFVVPDEANFAGKNFRIALKEYLDSIVPQGGIRKVTSVPWLQVAFPTEFTSIENGEIYEHTELVRFDANGTDASKRNMIDAKWNSINVIVINRIREKLKFWGLNRTVI